MISAVVATVKWTIGPACPGTARAHGTFFCAGRRTSGTSRDVVRILLCGPAERGASRHHAAIHRGANGEVLLKCVLQGCWRVRGLGGGNRGKQHCGEKASAEVLMVMRYEKRVSLWFRCADVHLIVEWPPLAPHGARLILTSFKGTPALSRSRMAPCQLFCSLVTLNTMTLTPFFNVIRPLSASSISGRASVNA